MKEAVSRQSLGVSQIKNSSRSALANPWRLTPNDFFKEIK